MFKRCATPDPLSPSNDESSGVAPPPKRICGVPLKFRDRGEPIPWTEEDEMEDIEHLPQRGELNYKSEMDSDDEQVSDLGNSDLKNGKKG